MTTQNKNNTSWLIDFVLLAAIWGASFMFMRVAAHEMGALPAAGLRVCIAALFLLPILLFKGFGGALRRHWKLTFAVGVLNSGIPFACFTFALLSVFYYVLKMVDCKIVDIRRIRCNFLSTASLCADSA